MSHFSYQTGTNFSFGLVRTKLTYECYPEIVYNICMVGWVQLDGFKQTQSCSTRLILHNDPVKI